MNKSLKINLKSYLHEDKIKWRFKDFWFSFINWGGGSREQRQYLPKSLFTLFFEIGFLAEPEVN